MNDLKNFFGGGAIVLTVVLSIAGFIWAKFKNTVQININPELEKRVTALEKEIAVLHERTKDIK